MKKINKESIQNFMLMHAEKLILGACIAATGLFVWTSMGGEKELKETPSDLLVEADRAKQYINRDNAWTSLEGFREGKDSAKETIEKANRVGVDASKFKFEMIGIPVATLLARQDPQIFRVEQPLANRMTVGVLLNRPGFESPLNDLLKASSSAGGAFQGGGGDFDGGDFGGPVRSGGLPDDYPKLDRTSVFHEVNDLTAVGLRPKGYEVPAVKITTNVLDVVAVTAVVDFQKQVKEFELKIGNSVGYNANRDRPVYQFLQVQRREVSDEKTDWVDISENVTFGLPRLYPKMTKMPFQLFSSAPEVISPANYDPILSHVIPAFVGLDYQKLASHPALTERREFPAWVPKEKMQKANGNTSLLNGIRNGGGVQGDGDTEEDPNEMRMGSQTQPYVEAVAMRKPGGQYRLVRFFDLEAPSDKTYEYRMRVWIGDPNQTDPADGFLKQRGMMLVSTDDEGVAKFKGMEGSEAGGVSMPGISDESMGDMGEAGGGIGGLGGNGRGMEGKPEAAQPIRSSMLGPQVRKRLQKATDEQKMQDQLAKAVGSGEAMKPFHVAEFTADGELEEIELPPSPSKQAYIRYLRYARPSPWSDTIRVEKKLPTASVFAGRAVRTKSPISITVGSGEANFDQVEPQIDVVVSSWVDYLGAKLPSKKRVHVGETLDFSAPAYLTHPITSEVLVAENLQVGPDASDRFILPFRSGTTIIDAFMGQELELPTDKRLAIKTPTEVLTMDVNGQLSVSNQFDSETNYRNEITEPDSSRYFGRPRRQRDKKDSDDGDNGDFEAN